MKPKPESPPGLLVPGMGRSINIPVNTGMGRSVALLHSLYFSGKLRHCTFLGPWGVVVWGLP